MKIYILFIWSDTGNGMAFSVFIATPISVVVKLSFVSQQKQLQMSHVIAHIIFITDIYLLINKFLCIPPVQLKPAANFPQITQLFGMGT